MSEFSDTELAQYPFLVYFQRDTPFFAMIKAEMMEGDSALFDFQKQEQE